MFADLSVSLSGSHSALRSLLAALRLHLSQLEIKAVPMLDWADVLVRFAQLESVRIARSALPLRECHSS